MILIKSLRFAAAVLAACAFLFPGRLLAADTLRDQFVTPPDTARPWVYWFVMDGNLTRPGIHADLEAMKKAGIGGAIFLDVSIGVPRGPVAFMGPEWRQLFAYAVSEAKRLGLQISLGSGPGWCGTGGSWVTPEQSMQHLVASTTTVSGPMHFDAVLPRPQPRLPIFGEKTLTPELHQKWLDYYRDEVVLAFPTPVGNARIGDTDHKALYYRGAYSSGAKTPPRIPAPADFPVVPADQCIPVAKVITLTGEMTADGHLTWDVPPGNWTVLRFGRTTTGQTSRPAPSAGLGFESDKFSKAALAAHLHAYTDTLFAQLGPNYRIGNSGLTMLHFDSWEMSSQNWTEGFRQEFIQRRGYDPLPMLPAMLGNVVGSPERSERFLWDLRQTSSELILENHARSLAAYAHRHGMTFSLEPYDLNPSADLDLGSAADLPMGEFWSAGYGYKTEYSCNEAVSVGHTNGRAVIGAEAFTASAQENWQQYPGSMKAQLDWALCDGINKFVIHRYQHQPDLDKFPGMGMGHYGVHWERTQTWWDFVPAFHTYITRCCQMLRQGLPVADILYLTPEGAPQVFTPPASALTDGLPDRKGYNFDGCSPKTLIARASVQNGRIVFQGGMSYRVLVLPEWETMTPGLLRKITELVTGGATVVGAPPRKSPSLTDYPACDTTLRALAARLWGPAPYAPQRTVGKGRIIFDPSRPTDPLALYPAYDETAALLKRLGTAPDFISDSPLRYIHRRLTNGDMYFISNVSAQPVTTTCTFRTAGHQPEWWNPQTGAARDLPLRIVRPNGGRTTISVRLAPYESGFVVFRKPLPRRPVMEDAAHPQTLMTLTGPWAVAFDPHWGGPAQTTFTSLDDWSRRPESGIKYYSGKALYTTSFDLPVGTIPNGSRYALALGTVKNMASVRLNGHPLGIVWCDPWQVAIPANILKPTGNRLEITVANLWINRLIGDSDKPQAQRLTSATYNPFTPTSPLQPSGLLGPVTVEVNSR